MSEELNGARLLTGCEVAVVGGGAAGLMAALWAARGAAKVVLLEGSKACGLKILVSGGGRCNVLPSESEPGDFFTQGSRHVLRRLLETWRLEAVRRFFEVELGIPLVLEEASGKLFPRSQSAREVRDRLVSACAEGGVELRCSWRVAAVVSDGAASFLLRSENGEELRAAKVILATGGRSLPKTGSDGSGYGIAEAFGHSLLPTYPALVPLCSPDAALRDLAGIALPVRWRAKDVRGKVLEERVRELLFTHKGFSGPAILDASHWWTRDRAAISVAWFDRSIEEWRELFRTRPARDVLPLLAENLPRRLARLLGERAGIGEGLRCGNLDAARRDRLLGLLADFPLPIDGDEGFAVAEVTGGGVPLGEVDPSTLESRKCGGLYLCGEILDAIGRIGGYNFLWAWATGRLAGESAARR